MKRQIVQLTMEPGASVAEVARAYGLNAKWRRSFERGELTEPYAGLLPVTVSSLSEPEIGPAEQLPQKQATSSGAIDQLADAFRYQACGAHFAYRTS